MVYLLPISYLLFYENSTELDEVVPPGYLEVEVENSPPPLRDTQKEKNLSLIVTLGVRNIHGNTLLKMI